MTVQYPEERAPIPEAYRNFPFLVSEDAADPMATLRCVACQICEKECPPQCIYIEKQQGQEARHLRQTAVLPHHLQHRYLRLHGLPASASRSAPLTRSRWTKSFEVTADQSFRPDLLVTREQLAKPNSYYHEHSRPTEADEVDDPSRRRAQSRRGKSQGRRRREGRRSEACRQSRPHPLQAAAPAPARPPLPSQPKTAEAPSAEAPKSPPTPAA